MTGDLLVIAPSRGRPRNVARLLDAVHATRRLATHVHIAVDSDDPCLDEYETVMRGHGDGDDRMDVGPRKNLTGWTNDIALRRAGEYPFLASFGDDHLPKTAGWDRALCAAIGDMGGTGFSYPWDGIRSDIPEGVVVSSDIVKALGWFANPACQHYWIDDTWADLGHGAGCIRHLRAVVVEHVHPDAGKAAGDKTYSDANEKIPLDRVAYFGWRADRMAGDIQVIRALREKAPQPA